jgi:hypothetical protein
MVVKPFSQRIDPNKVFDIQNSQYSERLLLADTVPANSTKLGKVTVANLGHFFCQFITDTGLSYLSGQLMDGSGQRKLFNEPIPLDLLLSPGRRKDPTSAAVVADPASNGLFFPLEFEYMFTANSDILFNVVNTSSNPNSYEIVFHGIRVVSSMVVGNRIAPAGGQLTRTTVQPQRRG